jgi:hypothetical protein
MYICAAEQSPVSLAYQLNANETDAKQNMRARLLPREGCDTDRLRSMECQQLASEDKS